MKPHLVKINGGAWFCFGVVIGRGATPYEAYCKYHVRKMAYDDAAIEKASEAIMRQITGPTYNAMGFRTNF